MNHREPVIHEENPLEHEYQCEDCGSIYDEEHCRTRGVCDRCAAEGGGLLRDLPPVHRHPVYEVPPTRSGYPLACRRRRP